MIFETVLFKFCAPVNLESLLVTKLSALNPVEWPFLLGQNLEITWNFMEKLEALIIGHR